MKIFTNKKIWQKIAIALVIIILFQFVVSSPSHADADVLLEPVSNLFVSLADGVEGILQSSIMKIDDSLIKVSDGNEGFWDFIVALVFIVGTAIAIIAAIPTAGGSVLAWIPFAGITGGVALTLTLGNKVVSAVYNTVTTIVNDMFSDTYYLPMYEISPYEIFADKVLLFDVNFFNPKEDDVEMNNDITEESTLDGVGGNSRYTNGGQDPLNVTAENIMNNTIIVGINDNGEVPTSLTTMGAEQVLYDGYDHSIDNLNAIDNICRDDRIEPGDNRDDVYVTEQRYVAHYDKGSVEYWIYFKIKRFFYKNTDGREFKSIGDAGITSADSDVTWEFTSYTKTTHNDENGIRQSTAGQLQSTVSSWYITLRNIALVALLSILVYIGIRIIISSTSNDKAKYKEMLGNWVVAICLLFIMHYIMAFSMTIVNKITDMISSINFQRQDVQELIEQLENNGNDVDIRDAVDLFVFDGTGNDETTNRVKQAYKTLVGNSNTENYYKKYFFQDSNFQSEATEESNAKVLLWPANNFMEQARMELQKRHEDGSPKYIQYGYSIIYVVLVIYTLIFCFTYLKRVIYMAFLTIIAPLVAVTYPIDKMNDGKAQAFDGWFKEYIFNLLIQPLHLILYFILIGSAMNFAANNIFYVTLGFFVPAEKLLRSFFGFEKAKTPGIFGGMAGSALMMSGLNALMRRPPKGGHGGRGNASENKEEEQNQFPWRDKEFDPTENLIGIGNGRPNNTNVNGEGGANNTNDTGSTQDQTNFWGNSSWGEYEPGDQGDQGNEVVKIDLNSQADDQGDNYWPAQAIDFDNQDDENNNMHPYDPRLTQDQVDELKAEGIEPGDPEYDQYLGNYGIRPNQAQSQNNRNTTGNSPLNNNMRRRINNIQRRMQAGNAPQNTNNNNTQRRMQAGNTNNNANNGNAQTPTRKRSIIRGIKYGAKGLDLRNRMHQRYKAKIAEGNGLGRRALRLAGGVVGATTLAAAGGLIGITSGDATKAAQYMATAAAGGYSLGSRAGNSGADFVARRKDEIDDGIKEAKKGYYGDDYKKVQQKKEIKKFIKDEENIKKLEAKLKIERKEAKEIMKGVVPYYIDHEITNIDDIAATYKLERDAHMSRDKAVATAQYATQVMNGEDTRYMTAKRKKEYRDTFVPKFAHQGSTNPDADVDQVFDNVNKFHEFKK